MSGNEAIALGARAAGVFYATGYPGTPSTEIMENLERYEEIDAHWAPNEKVAFEEGMGVAIAGRRALVTMKHVGLNVASDAFMVFPYSGTNGGFVVVSADDPGMHSSQNEQDNRNLARMARVPVVEPSDPQECHDYLISAYEISEAFESPVMYRTTTRTAHCKGVVRSADRIDPEPIPFSPDATRFSVPIYRHRLRPLVEERLKRLSDFAETCTLNSIEEDGNSIGVVASGISRQYARDVFPDADFFDLGLTYPLPMRRLLDFCARHETVYVVEEGDPFIEDQLLASGATNVTGKGVFGVMGEYSPDRLRAALDGTPNDAEPEPPPPISRPPMFCVGCGHRTVFDVLGQLKFLVAGDIGCYTMGALPPYEAEHTTFCMGASIGNAIGLRRAGHERAVAVIGDSTFLHSGIPGLMDAAYTNTPITVIILDNSTTGMTGQQPNPCSGIDLSGAPAPKVDLEALSRSLGITHVVAVDTWDRSALRSAFLSAKSYDGPAVVICRGPCQLLPEMRARAIEPLTVVSELCTECNACYRIHCPSITEAGTGLPQIDPETCVTCDVCQQLCLPGAIVSISDSVGLAAGLVPSKTSNAGGEAK